MQQYRITARFFTTEEETESEKKAYCSTKLQVCDTIQQWKKQAAVAREEINKPLEEQGIPLHPDAYSDDIALQVARYDKETQTYIPCDVPTPIKMLVQDNAIRNRHLWDGLTVEVLETDNKAQKKLVRIVNNPVSHEIWISNTKLKRIWE
jgi:hypothetical protein